MSININSLHIGSHVLVDGNRIRVCGITKRKIGYHPVGETDKHLYYRRLNGVKPIPITDALLKELGFRHDNTSGWRKEIDGYWLFVNGMEEQGWRFSLYPPRTDWARPVLYARHLHEIEGQLAYYRVELIKE